MTLPAMASVSALATSIQSRLPKTLQPLCDQASPDIPALDQTCQKLLSATGGSTSGDRISQLISRDLGLTCRVLHLANSVAYRPQQPITSVAHAVSWLGLDTVRTVIETAPRLEQLTEAPLRQRTIGGILARALAAAVHAIEFGMALEYPSQAHLFSLTLLYAIGDVCIANHDPDLYHALRRMQETTPSPVDRSTKEQGLLGVQKIRLAQAVAHLWSLPSDLVEIITSKPEPVTERWASAEQKLKGLVRGCSALVAATTGVTDSAIVTRLKRNLLVASGLPDEQFADLLARALDRSHQLIRSVGLSLEAWDIVQTPPAAPPAAGPAQAAATPQQSLQAFETALQRAKDTDTLLECLVNGLHREGGFARVALAQVHPKSADQLVGRMMLGVRDRVPYLSTLSGSLSLDHPFFSHLLNQTEAVLIEDFTTPLNEPIDPAFLHVWNPGAAIIAPVRMGTTPLGLILCDRGPLPQEVTPEDLARFHRFYGPVADRLNRLAQGS